MDSLNFKTAAATVALFLSSANAQSSLGGKGYVDLAVYGGTPDGKGAGILYGLPNGPAYSPNQAPDRSTWGPLYTGAGIIWNRFGGAQTPFTGYAADVKNGNTTGYDGRFASTLQNYKDMQALDPKSKYVLLPHDIWGADSFDAATTIYPCDNGDCAEYGRFLTKLIGDLKKKSVILRSTAAAIDHT
jgi:hypothetical protein